MSDTETKPPKPPTEPRPLKLSKVLANLASYSVFLIFGLYVIGFIIWHTHLRRFPAYPSSLLQLEFLSAALCYVVITSLFAVPCGCLFYYLEAGLDAQRKQHISEILLIWLALLFSAQLVILSDSGRWVAFHISSLLLYLFAALALILSSIAIVAHHRGRSIKRLSWFRGPLPLCLAIGAILVDIGTNTEVKGGFLYICMLFYTGTASGLGGRLQSYLDSPSILVRVMVSIFLGVAVIGNVILFGIVQFGSLPKSIGGGKPQLALLKFTEPSLGASLDLPATNGFYGPVAILLRSENEILFVPASSLTNEASEGMQVRAELVESIRFLNENRRTARATMNAASSETNTAPITPVLSPAP